MLSLLRGFTVGLLPPVHHAEQGITPRRRLPRPPRGPASPRRVRVAHFISYFQRCSQALPRYFYPNLRSSSSRASAASTCLIKLGRHTTVGSHSTAATSSSPPTLFATFDLFQRCSWAYHSRPSSKPTRKPPPRKSSSLFRVVQVAPFSRNPYSPAASTLRKARAKRARSLCRAKAMSPKVTSKGVPRGCPFSITPFFLFHLILPFGDLSVTLRRKTCKVVEFDHFRRNAGGAIRLF